MLNCKKEEVWCTHEGHQCFYIFDVVGGRPLSHGIDLMDGEPFNDDYNWLFSRPALEEEKREFYETLDRCGFVIDLNRKKIRRKYNF